MDGKKRPLHTTTKQKGIQQISKKKNGQLKLGPRRGRQIGATVGRSGC